MKSETFKQNMEADGQLNLNAQFEAENIKKMTEEFEEKIIDKIEEDQKINETLVRDEWDKKPEPEIDKESLNRNFQKSLAEEREANKKGNGKEKNKYRDTSYYEKYIRNGYGAGRRK
jgi:hypothetical protein